MQSLGPRHFDLEICETNFLLLFLARQFPDLAVDLFQLFFGFIPFFFGGVLVGLKAVKLLLHVSNPRIACVDTLSNFLFSTHFNHPNFGP